MKNGLLCLRSARSYARWLNIVLSIAQALAILKTLLQYFGSLGESYEKFFFAGTKGFIQGRKRIFQRNSYDLHHLIFEKFIGFWRSEPRY